MDSQEARDMLRLIDTVKYLIGIAERGEGRSIRDDETAEQFVLGYVKRLETCIERKYGTEECEGCADRDEEIDRLKDALRLAADEPNIDKARAIADAVLMPNAKLT